MNKDLPLRYVKNYPMDKPWTLKMLQRDDNVRGLTVIFLITFSIVERLVNCAGELADHFIHPP
jgi:hypothetical protein